jgi:hypothetical protein
MQTIKIQNCTEYIDDMMKLYVNGEKHIMNQRFNQIHVEKDKPFKLRAKYIWGGSREYTFEPKENMSLQIVHNHKLSKRTTTLILIAMVMNTVLPTLLEKGKVFLLFICFSLLIVPFIMRRKRGFIIREIDTQFV